MYGGLFQLDGNTNIIMHYQDEIGSWYDSAQSYPIVWQGVKLRGSVQTSKSPFL